MKEGIIRLIRNPIRLGLWGIFGLAMAGVPTALRVTRFIPNMGLLGTIYEVVGSILGMIGIFGACLVFWLHAFGILKNKEFEEE